MSSRSVLLSVHRDRRLIRDGEPRTATSTFTQLRSSAKENDDDVGLHVLGCRVDTLGTNCNKEKDHSERF